MLEIVDLIFNFLTLTILEIVLGIDNLIFIAIICQKLPLKSQRLARQIGLIIACVTRLILLACALQITKLVTPLFTIFNNSFSGRDIFLLAGGLFLLTKATHEIHLEIDPEDNIKTSRSYSSRFGSVVMQIALLDIVFSLDSVLTAIGLTQNLWLMAAAIIASIIVMIGASGPISAYIMRHPSIKMLALGFLLLIATVLVAEGFGFHIPRGYLYFAIAFSLFIEFLNLSKKKSNKLKKV